MSWVSVNDAAQHYSVSNITIRRWADCGKVPSRRTPTNRRQIKIPEDGGFTGRKSYIYIRVSSQEQKDDLKRQGSFLREKYPNHVIVADIGSGLNYHRKGLLSILDEVNGGHVEEIVVASKDRLCRFGFELVEWFCIQNHTELVVLEHCDESDESELAADLLDIIQVFCARRNGKRRYYRQNPENQIKTKTPSKEVIT